MLRRFFAIFLVVPFFIAAPAFSAEDVPVVKTYALSLFETLKYGPDFDHFDYVNPDAPKGGTVRIGGMGDFDSLNPFIVKGVAPNAAYLIYDTLLEPSYDEPSTYYGLVAEAVEYPTDYSWAIFDLRKEARFSDGVPLTADDVVFSFNTLKASHPLFQRYYVNVVKAEALGPHRVKFTFDQAGNRELPLIVGQMVYILPKHFWEGRDFSKTTLEPLLGSGPYKFGKVDPGRSLTMVRDENYWAEDLPVQRGKNNFDRLVFEYYRDEAVAQEAFKAGRYDYVLENSAKDWATAYDFPAVKSGEVKKEMLPDGNVQPMQGFVFNTRLAKFSDPRVRRALGYAMDFEWLNANLFYGQYTRTRSYFQNSELAATGVPTGDELALLEPFRDQLPPELFTTEYNPPSTKPPSSIRRNLGAAQTLLKEAGWEVRNGVLTNAKTGEQMTIEFLVASGSMERVVSPYLRNLERLGVKGAIRLVDVSQYTSRMDGFDFEVTVDTFPQTLSPGNEQRDFWSSQAAMTNGSRNSPGIRSPVVDALIDKIVFAKDRQALVTASRALDRVLQWGFYLVPQWNIPFNRVAYWNKFGHPDVVPKYTLGFPTTWWYEADKAATLPASDDNAD